MITDKILIWQFNRGRRQALHQIYERYKHPLVTLAGALLTDRHAAEDVVHDVFIGFIRSEGRFQLTGSLKSYLSTCVANAARNRNKADRKRKHPSAEEVAPPVSVVDDPASKASFGEDAQHLVWALNQLPYKQREVLVLRAYSNMRFAAIAAQQDTSIYTVQGRYRYAIEKMQKLMTEGSPPMPGETATQNIKLRTFYG